MRYPVLAQIYEKVKKLESPIIALFAGATTYYLFEGICKLAPESDLFTKGGFAVFSVAVGAGIYLLWRFILSTVPHLVRERRSAALGVVSFIVAVVMLVSSYLNSVGIFGDQAVLRDLWLTIGQVSDWVAAAPTRAGTALVGATELHTNKAKFTELANSEERGDGPTGIARLGAVSSMYRQVASVMGTAATDGDAKVEQARELTQHSEVHLAEMQQCLTTKRPLDEKMTCFSAAYAAVRSDLAQLSALDIRPIIRAAIAAAREAVPPVLSSNAAVAARQRQAIGQLHDNLDQLVSLTKLEEQKAPDPLLGASFHPPTVFDAVARHIFHYTPIVGAVGLADLFPVLLLLLSIIVEGQLNGEQIDDAAATFRVSDLLMARELEARLAAWRPNGVPPGPRPPPSRRLLPPACRMWPSCRAGRPHLSMDSRGLNELESGERSMTDHPVN